MFVFISLLLISLTLNAQSVIKGRVLDAANKQPVPAANLSVKGTQSGTAASAEGTFELKADRFPVVITVSHLKYKTNTITILKPRENLKVILQEKTSNLPATEIYADKTQNLVKEKPLFVYDYVFYGDSLLMLTFPHCRTRKASLLLMNKNGKELLRQPANNAKELQSDAMGNVHLFTKDSTYQLFVTKDKILKLYPASLNKFKSKIRALESRSGSNYYVHDYRYKNQVLDYYRYDYNEKESYHFRTIPHKDGVNMLRRDFYWRIQQKGFSEADLRFEEMAFYSPIHAPMIIMKDTIAIMNYIKDSIELYSPKGKIVDRTHIDFHHNKNWEEKLIVDQKRKKIYTLFSDGGLKKLKLVNLKNGKLEKSIEITNFRFPEKIKVKNKYVYFLYKDYKGQRYKKLYRMKI